jgi:hypothetical protein
MTRDNKHQICYRSDFKTDAEYYRYYKKEYNKLFVNTKKIDCNICNKTVTYCNYPRHCKTQIHMLKEQLHNSISIEDKEQ